MVVVSEFNNDSGKRMVTLHEQLAHLFCVGPGDRQIRRSAVLAISPSREDHLGGTNIQFLSYLCRAFYYSSRRNARATTPEKISRSKSFSELNPAGKENKDFELF